MKGFTKGFIDLIPRSISLKLETSKQLFFFISAVTNPYKQVDQLRRENIVTTTTLSKTFTDLEAF